LTTIGGLTPLLFERSFQAQFLIPMAISISFGLLFATILVLLFIPALLSLHESLSATLRRALFQAASYHPHAGEENIHYGMLQIFPKEEPDSDRTASKKSVQ
jgi:predicted RND superfamily exporter protein